MAGLMRVQRKRLVLLVLGAGVITAAIPFAAATDLPLRWNEGFIARVPLPNFSRVRLPDVAQGPEGTALPPTEVAQAIAESAQDTGAATPPLAPPAPAARVAGGRQASTAFIPVDFDVLTPGSGNARVSGDAITVRKAVRSGGKDVGSLPVHVDGDSRLLVDRDEVRGLLERAGVSGSVPGSGLVSLSDLRRSGIDLRYDPNSDAVVLAKR